MMKAPAGGGEDHDRRVGTENIEKTERAQVNVAFSINRAGKTNGPWSYCTEKQGMHFPAGQVIRVDVLKLISHWEEFEF